MKGTPVFISYARRTSAASARALHQKLADVAFLDQEEIEAADRFPERLVDALLGSRVIVVFSEEAYFGQRYCQWELQAALEPFVPGSAERLAHLVIVLPPGDRPSGLERFPPVLQATNWRSADDVAGVAELVRKQLDHSHITLAERYEQIGQPEAIVRARLLELSANPVPESLAGIRKFPVPFPETKRDLFVGRADDLWRIDLALGTLHRPAAALTGSIEGAGGIGKTQLAVEYAHRFGRRRFPGGIFWIDAEEDLEPQHHGILQALDPATPDLPVFRKEARSASRELAVSLDRAATDARILFIVDNIPEVRPKPLAEWCPALSKVTVLTTSRARLSTTEATMAVPIGVLPSEAAIQLLTAGVAPPTPLADCRLIAEWVGRLPLALTLLNAALRLKATTIEKLAGRARSPAGQTVELDRQMKMLQSHVPAGALRGITEAFAESYALLTPVAQEAARLISRLAPAPIPVELSDALGLSPEMLVTLVTRSFVTEGDGAPATGATSGPCLGSMHRVLADYLRTRAADPDAEWSLVSKALAALLNGLQGQPSRWRVMQACVAHLQHVLRTRPSLPDPRDAALGQLAQTLADCVGTLARPSDAGSELQSALHEYRMRMERRLESLRPALAESLGGLSLQELGQWEETQRRMERAVELRMSGMKPPEDLGPELSRFSDDWSSVSRTREEVDSYRQRVTEGGGGLLDLVEALRGHGSALRGLGRREEAMQATQEAIEGYRRLLAEEHPRVALHALGSSLRLLAEDLRALGREEEEQLKVLNEVVVLYRSHAGESGFYKRALAESLYDLSVRSGELGRREEAIQSAEEAVQCYRAEAQAHLNAPQDRNNLAASLNNLAVQFGERGRTEEALRAVDEALVLRRAIGGKHWRELFLPGVVRSLNVRSWLLDQLGRSEEARASADEAETMRARISALRRNKASGPS